MKKVLNNKNGLTKFTLFLILFLCLYLFTNDNEGEKSFFIEDINYQLEERNYFIETEKVFFHDIKKGDKIEDVVGINNNLSNFYLKLVNSKGANEFTHPKVISFKNKWNGYKYWIAYTPYPKGNQAEENPHIMASNDLINWKEKKYFSNPLDEVITDNPLKVYNSDTHLLYNSDADRIECYWRYVDDINDNVIIYKRTTRDGVNWTEKEVFLENKRSEVDYLSPVVMYENKKYMVWYVDKDKIIKYIEYDLIKKEWTEPIIIDIKYSNPNLQSWHLDVIKTDKGYESIVVAFDNWKNRGKMKLYYSFSEDNKEWSIAKEILSSPNNGGIYRSSILHLNNTYYVFYSEITKKYRRGIGIMYGTNIEKLNGLKIINMNKFKEYINKNG